MQHRFPALAVSFLLPLSAVPACAGEDGSQETDGTDAAGSAGSSGSEGSGSSGSASGGTSSGTGSTSTTGSTSSTGSTSTTTSSGSTDDTGSTGGEETSDGGNESGETGGEDFGPDSCDPIFLEVCTPTITYENDAAAGDGAMLDVVIPDMEAMMQDVACTVCSILYRDPSEVDGPDAINLHVYDFDGVANASGGGGMANINFSSRHIRNYDDFDAALLEFHGVLVHETTHLYQNDEGQGGMVEGMADFVRIRVGLYEPGRRQTGGNWDDAYTTGGFFFSWLAGPCKYHDDGYDPKDPDIGYAINEAMGGSWSTQLFMDRFGKDVDTLWDEYQAAIQ